MKLFLCKYKLLYFCCLTFVRVLEEFGCSVVVLNLARPFFFSLKKFFTKHILIYFTRNRDLVKLIEVWQLAENVSNKTFTSQYTIIYLTMRSTFHFFKVGTNFLLNALIGFLQLTITFKN